MCFFADPPISLIVSPNQARVLDISPYNNYTLVCNASMSANLSLLNITIRWVNETLGLPLVQNSSISITNFPPYRVGNKFIFSSVLSVTEFFAGQTRRICRAQVNIVEVVDGAVLSSRPVTALYSESLITIAGKSSLSLYLIKLGTRNVVQLSVMPVISLCV